MKQEKILKIGMVFVVLVLTLSFVSSAMRSNPQYTQFMGAQARKFDESMCEQGQDFLIQIAPFGCTPAVVRSDLLEEQNVPVFCQLGATKINPLINVEAIEGISFSGEYPPEVEGIAFHPARAALGIEGDLTNPVLNNIGYAVIVLKKQANASAMPDYVSGNLTARIKYNVKNAFGIGKANFYLPEMTDDEWERVKYQYGFWDGKGALRSESVEGDRAVISVYSGDDKISSVSLEKGEESGKIYLPGFDCLASLQLKLNSLENPDTRALLRINANVVEVAKGEKFLENKCQVVSLEKQGLVQKVKIKCKEDEGVNSFNLMIGPKVNLSIDNVEREVGLGDFLYKTQDEEKSVYLAYIGTKGDPRDVDKLFIYLVSMPRHKDKLSEDELASYNTVVGKLLTAGATSSGFIDISSSVIKIYAGLANLLARAILNGEEFYWINYDEEILAFNSKVTVNGFAEPVDSNVIDEIEYYQNAVDDYETIGESFVGEKHFKNEQITLDEEALYQQIILADSAKQKATVVELCNEFKSSYPDSKKKIKTYCDNKYKLSNQEISVGYVTINGESKKITFDGIYEPSIKDYSVKIFVSNAGKYSKENTLRKNGESYVSDNESIVLKELEEDYAVFDVSNVDYGLLKEITYDPKNLKIELGNYEIVGKNKYKISLEKINLRKSAKVLLSPGFEDAGTEASFGFKIGIEKRTFELSPDKIREQIEKLDEQLGKWQNFSAGLGKVVKGLKTACLATGAGLVFKNFLANTGGAGIARKYIMRGSGGWYERCVDIVEESGVSLDKCLLENADEIDRDVEDVTRLMSKQVEERQELEETISKINVLGESVMNTTEFRMQYSENVISYWKKSYGTSFADPDGKGENIKKEEMIKILSYEGWKNGNYNEGQLREIGLWAKVLEDDNANEDLKKMAEKELYSVLSDVKINAGDFNERTNFEAETGMGDSSLVASFGEINEIPVTERKTFGNTKYKSSTINKEDYVFSFKDSKLGEKYLLVYDEDGVVQSTYTIGDNDVLVKKEEQNPLDFFFKQYDKSSYENVYKNAEVHYYETEPYKGLPAIVPFDLEHGWYAATKQTLPVLGNIGAYDKSGAVNSFWLCNVGGNRLEENIRGDDDCAMINRGTGQPYDQFPGLDEREASKLVSCAFDAINDASRHKSGSSVNIKTSCGGSIRVKVGKPAVDIPEIECADLMSPKDCQLLFNVCDPVICPSSRCDLGGAYPVRDVVQSGIIGSLVLCLPNMREGILMPICLSGVHAGVEGWISVSTAYRDCLQNALDTGEMIGICDEIYSIHLCEFFWRQALPLADLAIPKIIGALVGQNVRGGGEYLSVENAWTTAKDSVTYFTQYYGANANKAFKARTTEEVGTEICKLSISAVYASGVDIIDGMTEPDSPSQFHGRFDEIPFSSVTVPPTSHYKVFYHIFAGKDSGAYYKVYLKGIPESSYYQDASSTLIIASGYIETGGYASETRDLTAVSGYKQLCINVNGQEECGFKEVSTSFALDYISDKYVASQIQEIDIKTERECISGSASAYSILNPNVQVAAEEIINPAIYNRGIIRICATRNPGEGSDPYAGAENSRWKEVGYCGSENIKCWLDTENIKNIIEGTGIAEDALESVAQSHLAILRNSGEYITEKEFKSKVKEIDDEKDNSEKLILIEEIFENVFLNREKGYLHLLRGNAYAKLAMKAIGEEADRRKTEVEEDKDEEGDKDEKIEVDVGKIWEYAGRYEKLVDSQGKNLFEKYAKENKPKDDKWSVNRFKALLVAIAIRQSNLGYPDGEKYDPRWIMEYGWKGGERIEDYLCNEEKDVSEEGMLRCAEVQIMKASSTLKLALNKMKSLEYYNKCNSKIDFPIAAPNNHLKCVLSVYYTGQKTRIFTSSDGKEYAKETVKLMEVVEDYFDS
ncbi:hypothetical protein KAT24_01940 [Candidatus Pacearchaeota archaeon]|nr:hypothetical protein [Candidatus Pacearchaeota archaeon]